jgi:acyl-CoA synthetase (NDP forming)
MGLSIKPFSPGLQNRLAEYLKDKVPPSNNRRNPVDLVWAPIGGAAKVYADCLEMIMPEVDVCLVITYAFLQEEWFRQKLVELRDRLNKPILLIPGNPPDQMDGMISAVRDGLPAYVMPDNAIRCIGAMAKRAEYLRIRR